MHRRSQWSALALLLASASVATTEPTRLVTRPDGTIEITIHGGSGQSPDDPVAFVSADPARVARERAAFEASRAPETMQTASQAIAAARSAGLAKGIEPWHVALSFDPTLGAAVWRVANTGSRELGREAGRTITIDALSGAVLASNDWSLALDAPRFSER
jgi:hypothetical protein